KNGCDFFESFAQHLCYQVTGEIIGSRAESTRSNDQICSRERFACCLLDLSSGVGDGYLAGDIIAEVSEAAAEPLLVCVENATQQKLAASIDEFNGHGRRGQCDSPGPEASSGRFNESHFFSVCFCCCSFCSFSRSSALMVSILAPFCISS